MDLTDNRDFVLPAKERNDGLQYTKQLVYDGCHVPGMFTKPEQNHNDFQIAIQCQHSGCTIKFLTKASLVNSWISVRICNRTAGKFLDSAHWTATKQPSNHAKHKCMAYDIPVNVIQSFTQKVFEHWHRYCDDIMWNNDTMWNNDNKHNPELRPNIAERQTISYSKSIHKKYKVANSGSINEEE